MDDLGFLEPVDMERSALVGRSYRPNSRSVLREEYAYRILAYDHAHKMLLLESPHLCDECFLGRRDQFYRREMTLVS